MEKSYKIILVSDNHGLETPLKVIRERNPDAYCFIHCGDSEMPEPELRGYAHVRGNNDYYPNFPENLVIPIENHRIYVTHGHRDIGFYEYDRLAAKAKSRDCDIVMFGHTHMYFDEVVDGIHLLNPGSLRYNRDLTPPCYMIIMITGDEIKAHRINYPGF